MSEADYPYEGVDGQCRFDKSQVKVNITSWVEISQNEDSKDGCKVLFWYLCKISFLKST